MSPKRAGYWIAGGSAFAVSLYLSVVAVFLHGKEVIPLLVCLEDTRAWVATPCRLSLRYFHPTQAEIAALNTEAGAQYIALYNMEDGPALLRNFQAAGLNINAIDQRTPTKWTALHMAAMEPNAKAVRLLLAHGAKPDITDSRGKTPAEAAEEAQLQRPDPRFAEVIALLEAAAQRR